MKKDGSFSISDLHLGDPLSTLQKIQITGIKTAGSKYEIINQSGQADIFLGSSLFREYTLYQRPRRSLNSGDNSDILSILTVFHDNDPKIRVVITELETGQNSVKKFNSEESNGMRILPASVVVDKNSRKNTSLRLKVTRDEEKIFTGDKWYGSTNQKLFCKKNPNKRSLYGIFYCVKVIGLNSFLNEFEKKLIRNYCFR